MRIDGDTLAPEAQLLLTVLDRRREPPLESLPPADAREARRRLTAAYAGKPVPVASVRDLDIEGIRGRHYSPPEPGGPHPLLVYYHGGGFTYGDLDTHDGVCRVLCRHAGAHVLAVDYRLAPEHPFPAAVDDAHAASGGRSRTPSGSAPIRAGSASAATAPGATSPRSCRSSRARRRTRARAPAADLSRDRHRTTRHRSRELFREGFLLTDGEMNWFEDNYLGDARTHAGDPRASPLLAEDLSGLAPAFVVTAAFDPLRDEGEAYARALQQAGTSATLRRFAGLIHGFINAAGVSRAARDALVEIAGVTRAMFFSTTVGSEPPP